MELFDGNSFIALLGMYYNRTSAVVFFVKPVGMFFNNNLMAARFTISSAESNVNSFNNLKRIQILH